VSTPNIESWATRWLQMKYGEHISYFSKTTLTLAMSKLGFQNVEVMEYDRYRSLAALSKSSTFRAHPVMRGMLDLAKNVLPQSWHIRLPARENLLALCRK
jgi:hypothetical protein